MQLGLTFKTAGLHTGFCPIHCFIFWTSILQTGRTGNVLGKKCQEMGKGDDEVWRFGENPTMIVHTPSGKCLMSFKGFFTFLFACGKELVCFNSKCYISDNVGTLLVTRQCSFTNRKQHWTLFPRNHLFLSHKLDKIYYRFYPSLFYSQTHI